MALPAAAALLVLLALGLVRWPIAGAMVAPKLKQALERDTSYRIESFGKVTFNAFPWPSLQITDLVLRKPASPNELIEAPIIKARINLASWLFGEPRFVALTLFDPELRLSAGEHLGETEALSAAVLRFLGRDQRRSLKALRIERGTIQRHGQPWLTDLQLKIGGAGGAIALAANGRLSSVSFMVEGEASAGNASSRPVRWSMTTPAYAIKFEGALLGPRSFDAEGRLSLEIADGSALARRLNLSPDHVALLNDLSIVGRARLAWPLVQLREAKIERGATRLDGSIEISAGGRVPAVAATLDADRFDLMPIIAPLAASLRDRDGRWSSEPFRSGWLSAANLDLRLSASRMTAGALAIEQAAFSAQLGGGRLDMILSDGRLRSGMLKARLSLSASRPDVIDMRGQASIDRVEAQLAGELLGFNRLRGMASGQAAFEGTAGSLSELMAAAKGSATITIRDGELQGVDLDRVATRSERIAAGAPPPDGRTRFSSLLLQLRLQQGKATLYDSLFTTPATRVPIEGTIGLDNRMFDLALRPLPGGEAPRSGEMRLRLEGPWSNPILAPDATGKLNRT
jgi:AsmA protein